MADRAELIDALYADATHCAVMGLRRRNPEATDEEIRSQLLLRRFGHDFVEALPPEVR